MTVHSKHNPPPAIHDHPVVEVQRHGPREHQSLDIAPDALEVPGALAMIDANDILIDDRPVIELLSDVVGRGPD